MKRLLVPMMIALAAPASAGPRTETAVLAGGLAKDANYDRVGSERTGHAEAVRITYDPSQIGYARLLQIYFAVAHDPTQVNRQGPDEGPSYRSAIFPQNPDQAAQAKAFIARLKASHAFKAPIATRIESGGFYPAEAYHQDFARKHPYNPYIVTNDRPKVAALKSKYPNLFKA
jgi:peptide-methionine (S)-S-oxide reductase